MGQQHEGRAGAPPRRACSDGIPPRKVCVLQLVVLFSVAGILSASHNFSRAPSQTSRQLINSPPPADALELVTPSVLGASASNKTTVKFWAESRIGTDRGQPSRACTGEHAPGALIALRDSGKEYCEGWIRCMHRKLDYAETFCEVRDLVVDLHSFLRYLEGPRARAGDEPDSRDAYYITGDPPVGTFSSKHVCPFNASLELFHKGSARDLRTGWGFFGGKDANCVVVNEPTVFLSKIYGKGNMWHSSEDLLHTFESSQLFDWRKGRDARLLILDAPKGITAQNQVEPYFPVYEATFAPKHGYSAAWQYFETLGNHTCVQFERSYWQPHGGSSAFQRSVAEKSACINSPLITAMVDTILDAVAPKPTQVQQERVTAIIRNVSTVRSVQSPAWDAFLHSNLEDSSFEFVDFATLSIVDQIKIARASHKLIGLHGAALTHALWMQPESHLIEVDMGFRCHCYANIASWVGIQYTMIAESQLGSFSISGS